MRRFAEPGKTLPPNSPEDSISGWVRACQRGRGIHHFHLRVPALDAVLHVERHDAYVDGFDDILVENP